MNQIFIACMMCNVNQHITGFRFRNFNIDLVFVYIDMDIQILKIYLRNMLKNLI